MTSYKLHYFNGRGRAESIRMLFKLAGVKFEDIRIDRKDWPLIKPTVPTLQLPLLEVDGKKVVQSKAILRYLGRKFGLYGKDDMEALWIDMVVDTVDDVVNAWYPMFLAQGEEEKAKQTKHFKEVEIPLIYTRLQRLFEMEHSGDFFVGNTLTAADLHFFTMSEGVNHYNPCFLDDFPLLKDVFDRVGEHPVIAEWRHARPVTVW